MGAAETRRGAAALRPYTTADFKLEAIYLRPVIARLARIRRLAPVRRNGRRSRVRRGRRTFAMRRHGRRGALRGSGRVGIPAAIVAIVIGVFCLGTVVAIVVDVLGVDYLATPVGGSVLGPLRVERGPRLDRKSTRLNSSHLVISYAVFCLKKKKLYTTGYDWKFIPVPGKTFTDDVCD